MARASLSARAARLTSSSLSDFAFASAVRNVARSRPAEASRSSESAPRRRVSRSQASSWAPSPRAAAGISSSRSRSGKPSAMAAGSSSEASQGSSQVDLAARLMELMVQALRSPFGAIAEGRLHADRRPFPGA